jgi:hypothetical protein
MKTLIPRDVICFLVYIIPWFLYINTSLARPYTFREVHTALITINQSINYNKESRFNISISTVAKNIPRIKYTNSFRIWANESRSLYYIINIKQGSPLSPVIYMLYLAELLNQNLILCFGYTDDLYLYYVTKILERNIELLVVNIRSILEYNNKNKIFFVLEKIKIIYFSRKYKIKLLSIIINKDLMIYLIITNKKKN